MAMAQQAPLKLPTPTLTKDYHLEVDLDPKINLGVGPGGSTYNWVNFQGGTWTAPWGNGTVVGGGQDYQYILPGLSAQLNTRYLLKTSDEVPAYIQINTNGWRTGPLSVLEALNDPKTADTVDPSTYKFRLYVNMQTNDPRYDHVNTTMWIGSGIRMGAKVIYDAYVVG